MDADPTTGSETYIYANRYNKATDAWYGSAQMIGTNTGTDRSPQVAVDAQGNGICVWEGSNNIQYARYNAGTGTWEAVQSITSTTPPAVLNTEPAVAMDPNGNAMVVWMEWSMSYDDVSIKARHYPAGGPWDPIVTLLTSTYQASYLMPQPQVAMDAQGNAIAVWLQLHSAPTDTAYHVYAGRYTAANKTWGTAAAIEASPYEALYPRIAMNAGGAATVAWRNRVNASEIGVYANRFSPSTGWLASAELVSQQTVTASNAFLVLFADVDCAVNDAGESIVVYGDYDANGGLVYAKHHAQGSGWSAAEKVHALAGLTLFPQVAMDAGGNAVVLWAQSTGAELELWSDNYVAGQGWSTAQRIGSGLGVSALSPFWPVALDGSGDAVAAWIQFSGYLPSVYASRGK
jgi:hypothetical protein